MYFTVFKDTAGQWRWNFRAANHQVIASGAEGYINKQDCLHGVRLLKANASGAAIWDEPSQTWI